MINSFFGINTTLNGLLVQQAEQSVLADNIAKTGGYVDANGYVITTEQQLNITQGAPYNLNSSNGNLAIGTGPLLQSITRMRDSFLDKQIQQQSQTVGYDQVLSNLYSQLQGILAPAGSTTANPLTLEDSIKQMGNTFQTLANDIQSGAPSATIFADEKAAVNAGVNFATLAKAQDADLRSIQNNLNDELQGNVASANGLLQQIAQINQELNRSQGSNQNDLLDARDYAVTLLSRLMNVQVNYSATGTASVYLGGLALVGPSGASTLQMNVDNPHDTELSDISLQTPQGTIYRQDVSPLITGGTIGGDLNARDVVLQSYLEQVDQVAFSTSQIMNIIYSSGYDPSGATGTNFFVGSSVPAVNPLGFAGTPIVGGDNQVGVSAQEINVNPALITAATNGAGSLFLAVSNDSTNLASDQIAKALALLPNLLTNNFVMSNPSAGNGAGLIDPSQPFATAANMNPISTGTITIDGTTSYSYSNADSINSVLQNISGPNVTAIFNYNAQQVFIFSDTPVTFSDSPGGFALSTQLNDVLTSAIRMNNGFVATDAQINPFTSINSTPNNLGYFPGVIPRQYSSGNQAAFRVTPSTEGTFTINGTTFSFINNPASGFGSDSLVTPGYPVSPALAPPGSLLSIILAQSGTTGVGASFDAITQQFILTSPNGPIQVSDKTGNFSVFTGLNANVSADTLASNLLSNVNVGTQTANLSFNQSNDVLTQLNNEQANIGTLTTATSGAGTPVSLVEEQAMQALVAYNASLEMLQIQNQMFADLLSVVAPPPPSGATPFVL